MKHIEQKIIDEIAENYEDENIERIASEYASIRCTATEFGEIFPVECNESGDYCQDCWIKKINEIISSNNN